MNVLFSVPEDGSTGFKGLRLSLDRLPALGEYVAINATDTWYEVKVITHTQFEGAEWVAEIWAVPVSQDEALRPIHEYNTPGVIEPLDPDIADAIRDYRGI